MGNLLKETPYSEITASLEVLDFHRVSSQHLARLRSDKDYARRVAEFMLRGGIDGSVHHKLARATMDQNFFGVEEWEWTTLYGANFSKKQLRDAGKFPWGEDILNSTCPLCGKVVKDCHFAFLGLTAINGAPLTVAKWLELHPATDQPKFYFNQNPWHVGQPHTDTAAMQLRYYLLHTEIVPNSTDKTPEEQAAMFPPEYEVPSTIAETTKDILVFRKTGVRPNGSRWAACTERTVKTNSADAGFVSCVGYFGESGLGVSSWGGNRFSGVGVGASRKF